MNYKTIIAFVIGAGAGIIGTKMYLDQRYRSIADDEINDMRAYYENKYADKIEKEIQEHSEEADEEEFLSRTQKRAEVIKLREADKKEATKIATTNKYGGYFTDKPDLDADEIEDDEPYIITPEQFGELNGYEEVCVTYYADDYLADETGELIDGIDYTFGWDCLNHIGDYEEDVIHVRNDSTKCDYEIVRSSENWKDVHPMIYEEE